MTTKHTPATPLPFTVELDALTERGEQYVVVITDEARKLKSIVAKVNGALIAPEHGNAADLSAYIAHAANAYPRLVAALNGLLSERNAIAVELAKHTGITMTDHGERERCYALLRELGESE